MNDFGIKVSLPGYDVKTATPEQCAVHSSYPTFKSKTNQPQPHFATLDVDFTASVVQGVIHTLYTVDHNYGYIPFSLSDIQLSSATIGSPPISGLGSAQVGATLDIQAYCTTTQFIVTLFDNALWTDATARLLVSYYIFAEEGT